ncbi:hypothetical protein BDQ12DRAFT_729217 [Crucibulum laeve]|uniref:Uncharacterized protein n=1 Tax=Crucibulum laeve TaxID=68775 RepID=A0A5C3LHZ8_9AGAR|nr:hypothetical protein BDQ12DRAFT_729217 [Crucibulum laeve]
MPAMLLVPAILLMPAMLLVPVMLLVPTILFPSYLLTLVLAIATIASLSTEDTSPHLLKRRGTW